MVIVMTIESQVPLAEAKAHLSELVGRVRDEHERIVVTVHGQPSAILMATDDVDALEETIAILSDPSTMAELRTAEQEEAAGLYVSQEDMAKIMAARQTHR